LDNAFEPRIADFGRFKSIDHDESLNELMLRGTLRFMASEISEGSRNDLSAGVYAYAMLVYMAMTGLDIFSGLQKFRFMAKILSGGRPPLWGQFDDQWQDVIRECWHQNPKIRPTFREIAETLESDEFVNESIDVDCFRAYQTRVLRSDELFCPGIVSAPVRSDVTSSTAGVFLDKLIVRLCE
jgi:hypothetical protein